MCVICDIMGSQKSTIQAKHDRAKNPQTGANRWKWLHARQLQEWVARSHLGWLQPLSTTHNTSAFPLTRSCYNFTQTATSRLHPVCKDLKKHIKLASINLADSPRAILIKGVKTQSDNHETKGINANRWNLFYSVAFNPDWKLLVFCFIQLLNVIYKWSANKYVLINIHVR